MDGFKSLTHEIRSCEQLTKSQGPRYQSKNAKGSGASAKRFSKIRSLGLRRKRKVEEGDTYVKWWPKLQKMHLEMMTVMLFLEAPPVEIGLGPTHNAPKGKIKMQSCISMHQLVDNYPEVRFLQKYQSIHVKSFLLHLQTLRKATHCSEQWLQKLPRAWTVTFGSPGFQGNGGTSQKLHRQWTWRRDTVKRLDVVIPEAAVCFQTLLWLHSFNSFNLKISKNHFRTPRLSQSRKCNMFEKISTECRCRPWSLLPPKNHLSPFTNSTNTCINHPDQEISIGFPHQGINFVTGNRGLSV